LKEQPEQLEEEKITTTGAEKDNTLLNEIEQHAQIIVEEITEQAADIVTEQEKQVEDEQIEDVPEERTRIVTDVDEDDDNNGNDNDTGNEQPEQIAKDEESLSQPDVILQKLVAAVDELSLQDNENDNEKVTVVTQLVQETETKHIDVDIDNENDDDNDNEKNTDTNTDTIIVTKENALHFIEAAAHYEVNNKTPN